MYYYTNCDWPIVFKIPYKVVHETVFKKSLLTKLVA